jgi:hypothetical protein
MSERIKPASSSGIGPRQTRLQSVSQALTATDVKKAIREAWIGDDQNQGNLQVCGVRPKKPEDGSLHSGKGDSFTPNRPKQKDGRSRGGVF